MQEYLILAAVLFSLVVQEVYWGRERGSEKEKGCVEWGHEQGRQTDR